MRRIIEIPALRKSDIVFVHREAAPFFFTTIESLYRQAGCRVIYDFDDAIFLDIPSIYNSEIRWLRNPRKTDRLVKMANHVIVGNTNLAGYARQHNPCVSIIPTPVDLFRYHFKPEPKCAPQTVTIGWFGSRFSSYYLKSLEPVLATISARYPQVIIKLVDVYDFMCENPQVQRKRFSWADLLSDLHSFDIGIMPLFDDEIARYKCAFKLLQYMAVGLPVVCSPIGMNAEVVENGVNGFWANSHDEWIDRLSCLIENEPMRRQFGRAGRAKVEAEFSVEVNYQRLRRVFETVLALPNDSQAASARDHLNPSPKPR